jgi:hypothetical protein
MQPEKETPAPILFIHKGNSDYLRYTVEAARLSNPGKAIIFLGDASNAYLRDLGVRHVHFMEYNQGPEIDAFHRVYQPVKGAQHGRDEWLKFVFQRWYHIHHFIQAERIDRFWTFDSDTIILGDLAAQEEKFKGFDCTEQCEGICMNGYIGSRRVVKGYVQKMNELFTRPEYLRKQQADFADKPGLAFTEMRAYETYKAEDHVKTFHLQNALHDETYDDCICMAHGMETYDAPLYDRLLKKMYWRADGEIFFRRRSDGKFLKVNTLNMSWVPTYLYPRILKIAARKRAAGRATGPEPTAADLNVLPIHPPLAHRSKAALNTVKVLLAKTRSWMGA